MKKFSLETNYSRLQFTYKEPFRMIPSPASISIPDCQRMKTALLHSQGGHRSAKREWPRSTIMLMHTFTTAFAVTPGTTKDGIVLRGQWKRITAAFCTISLLLHWFKPLQFSLVNSHFQLYSSAFAQEFQEPTILDSAKEEVLPINSLSRLGLRWCHQSWLSLSERPWSTGSEIGTWG